MCRDFMRNARNRTSMFSVLVTSSQRKQQPQIGTVVVNVMAKVQTHGQANNHTVTILLYLCDSSCNLQKNIACLHITCNIRMKEKGAIQRGIFLMEKGMCCILTAANEGYHNKAGY